MRALGLAALTLGLLVALSPSRASAQGALDRFEGAHQPPPSSSSSSSPPPSSSSSDSSSTASDSSYDSYDTSGSSTATTTTTSGDTNVSGSGALALLAFCMVPPFTVACVMPPYRVAKAPYGGKTLFIRPVEEEDELGRKDEFRPQDLERARIGEASIGVYRALNENVLGHQMDVDFWPWHLRLHGRWERLYERVETRNIFDSLDIFGLHLGTNLLGPLVDHTELYLLLGATLLHGEALTPAFDVGTELRAYPRSPLAINASAFLSIFGYGPPLLDARLGAGIARGPFEVRVGARWLYQGDAQGFWGPTANALARF